MAIILNTLQLQNFDKLPSHTVLNPRNASWDSRLSEGFSPGRERLTWEGEILGYTGRFSPERELTRLGEKNDVLDLSRL
ncbi:hypothetical protein Lal_00014521 [Lupinus albus]|nr:hypothetical protein Lal_00014521 [Lupinus albus]